MNAPLTSIVVPTFREVEALPELIDRVAQVREGNPSIVELLIVGFLILLNSHSCPLSPDGGRGPRIYWFAQASACASIGLRGLRPPRYIDSENAL